MFSTRWFRISLLIVGSFFLWIFLLRFPTEGVRVDLDPTWRLLAALDLLRGARAGEDMVFTYGPLGYLLTPQGPFVAEAYWLKFFTEILAKALCAFALVRFTLSLSNPWIRLLCYLQLIALVPWYYDSIYYLGITAATLSAMSGSKSRYAGVLMAGLIAPLGMVKFTFAVMGLACVILLALAKAVQGKGLSSLLPLGSYVVSFLVVWLGIGQGIGDLPGFIKGALEISTGYNQAMFLGQSPALLGIGVLAVLSYLVWIMAAWWQGERNRLRSIQALVLSVPAVLCWKAGYVRGDAGHAILVLSALCLLPLWGTSLLESGRRTRFQLHALLLAPVGLGWAGVVLAGTSIGWGPADLGPLLEERLALNQSTLLHPLATRADLEADEQANRKANDLPLIRKIVGKAKIDEIPHSAAILYLNGLTIHHRPVFQSYSAYTPYLQTLNGVFFESERAPSFVLLKITEIDNKVPLQADSQTYRVLLERYRPVAFESGWLLLKKRPGPFLHRITGIRRGTQAAGGRARLDSWIELPKGEGLGELAIDLKPSFLGKVQTFLFRPPNLYLDLRLEDGSVGIFRSPVPSMKLPFLLDPPIRSPSQFLQLYLGKMRDRVTAIRLRPSAGKAYAFHSEFEWTLDRVDLAAAAADDVTTLRDMVWKLDYPLLPLPPESMTPPKSFWNAQSHGRSVLLSHPESRLALEAPKGSFRFHAAFGIVEGAYKGNNHTDGVGFKISTIIGDLPPIVVFERFLDPLENPGDRSLQTVDVAVSWDAPGLLILETSTGPTSSWDWSFWTGMKLSKR